MSASRTELGDGGPFTHRGTPVFEVLVHFPDVTVYLQGGVDGGTVDALLAALQQR